MSARINLFKSAFNDNIETLDTESGKSLKDALSLDYKNCLVSVNGNKADENYILKDGDIVTVRQFPGDSPSVWVSTLNWVLDPIGSLVTGIRTNDWSGSAVHTVKEMIAEKFEQGGAKENTESIPTISGAKNQSGAGKVIPLLIGESLYSPIYCAQPYTDIDPNDGSDGENQYFHGLYCLGYNDIDLRRVSLGIYPLTTDRQNGTSKKSLDCSYKRPTSSEKLIKCEYNIEMFYSTPEKDIFLAKKGASDVVQYIEFYLPVTNTKDNVRRVRKTESYSLDVTAVSNSSSSKSYKKCNVTSISYIGINGKPYVRILLSPPLSSSENIYASSFYSLRIKGFADMLVEIESGEFIPHYNAKKYFQKIELQQGGNEVDLFPQKVVQESFNTELLHPQGADALYCMPFSAKYPQKVQIEIQFQNLIKYNDKGEAQDNEVEIGVAYSLDGGSTYKPFSAFYAKNSSISITDNGNGIFDDGSGSFKKTKFSGKKNKTMRFVAEKTFSFDDVFNTDTETKLKNNAVEFKIFRVGEDLSESDSKLQYKVYFSSIRTWCYDYKKTKEQFDSNGTKSLVIQKPVAEKYMKMTSRLGFSIKSGDELNGQMDELNVVMCSRARYCTVTENSDGEKTYAWSNDTQPTNNPASIALMILQHPMRGEYVYTDDMLDMESFGKFYEFCNQTDSEVIGSDLHKYTANGVLSKEMKTFDLVNEILSVGHGKLVLNGSKYAVWFDAPQDTPVMILNNQNILEASNAKEFSDQIDGYSAKFIDSLNDYQEDTQICVPRNTEKPESEYKLENLEVPWITDIGRVYRHCMYRLACAKLRPETWSRKLSVDGNLIGIGNLVLIQDDTLSIGIGDGAEITSVSSVGNYITSIEVDYPFTVADASKEYGVKVQHSDNTNGVRIATYKLAPFENAGEYNVLTFADSGISLDESITPAVGDIVSFGLFSRETTPALCFEKQDSGDGTYTFKFVPYQDGVYEAESGAIPEFVSNVTSPSESGAAISSELPPVSISDVSSIVTESINESRSEIETDLQMNLPPDVPTVTATATRDSIKITCGVDGEKLNNSIRNFIVVLYKGADDKTGTTITADGSECEYVFNRRNDGYPEASVLGAWKVKAKATNFYNLSSEFSNTVAVGTSGYGTWQVQKPDISTRVNGRNITLFFTQPARSDGKESYGTIRYQVQVKRTSESAYSKPAVSSDPYASEANYKDGSGFVSSGETYQQVMPLEGQNAKDASGNALPSPSDTAYTFSVKAYNEANVSAAATVNVIAMATSAYDIVNAAITENKIAASAVSTEKINNSAITTTKISDEAITTAKIAAGAVTANEIAANTITSSQIKAGGITGGSIAANTITADKMAVKDLAAISGTFGQISGGGKSIQADNDNFWNLEKGEFRVGNDIGLEDTSTGEPKTNANGANYLHFTKKFGLAISLQKFIVTSIASTIKGVFKVQSNTGTDFITANPESDTRSGVSAKTVSVDGGAVIKGTLTQNGNEIKSSLQTLDLSSLDQSLYYPCVINVNSVSRKVELMVDVSLNSNTKPSWSTHPSGFSCHFHVSLFRHGWGTNNPYYYITRDEYKFANLNPVGFSQMTESSNAVLWLRGGGKYFVTTIGTDSAFSIKTSAFTAYNQTVQPRADRIVEGSHVIYENFPATLSTLNVTGASTFTGKTTHNGGIQTTTLNATGEATASAYRTTGNAVVLGRNATANSNYSTALGLNAKASSLYSTALGNDATASGYSSTALGNDATASGNYSTALGNDATASGDYSTALGLNAKAIGYSSTALGNDATASGYSSTALGLNAKASGDYSTALGRNATAKNTNGICIGSSIDGITSNDNPYPHLYLSIKMGTEWLVGFEFPKGTAQSVVYNELIPLMPYNVVGTGRCITPCLGFYKAELMDIDNNNDGNLDFRDLNNNVALTAYKNRTTTYLEYKLIVVFLTRGH